MHIRPIKTLFFPTGRLFDRRLVNPFLWQELLTLYISVHSYAPWHKQIWHSFCTKVSSGNGPPNPLPNSSHLRLIDNQFQNALIRGERLMDLKEQIQQGQLPEHIAIIMDGNGRWAKQQGKPRVFGHRNGVKAVRETTEAAAELGVKYLTLYAFSTENWSRPKLEVNALMALLVDTIKTELNTLNKNNIRLQTIGDIGNYLPKAKRHYGMVLLLPARMIA